MEQLKFFETKKKTDSEIKTCAFTGHRRFDEDFSALKLKAAIKTLMERGVNVFYNGMAIGFDLLAAEYVLELKEKYPSVKLVACVPCYGQEKSFSATDKKRYVEILKNADETTVLSEHYFKGCMQVRNKYMAERADMLVAYCKKNTGGAAYTVKVFQKLHPEGEILFI